MGGTAATHLRRQAVSTADGADRWAAQRQHTCGVTTETSSARQGSLLACVCRYRSDWDIRVVLFVHVIRPEIRSQKAAISYNLVYHRQKLYSYSYPTVTKTNTNVRGTHFSRGVLTRSCKHHSVWEQESGSMETDPASFAGVSVRPGRGGGCVGVRQVQLP